MNHKIQSNLRPLNLGWIPYWNLLPLKTELQRSLGPKVQFVNGHPTSVNKWLAEGTVDAAPCSSICLALHPHLEIAAPIGVAAEGAVQSVYFGFRQDQLGYWEDLLERQRMAVSAMRDALTAHSDDPRRTAQAVFALADEMRSSLRPLKMPVVNFTPSSATSVMLAKVLLRLWFGEEAKSIWESRSNGGNSSIGTFDQNQPTFDLLIGDEALLRRSEFAAVIDFGLVWKQLTDLPFVFAVWQAHGALQPTHRRMVIDIADFAQAKMRVEPADYSAVLSDTGPAIDLASYWKLIQYRLGPDHLRAMALFFALARKLRAMPAEEELVVKIARWHQGDAARI